MTTSFYLTAIIGAIVSFVVGCLWYTVIFGKVWQREMGFTDEKVKSIFVPKKIIFAFISEWMVAFCMTGVFTTMQGIFPGALMVAVIIIFSGIKLAVFDGKSLKVMLIKVIVY